MAGVESSLRFTARGSALIVALLVLSLAAVVALAAARSTVFGLRVASAAQTRLQLRTAAENALERALARRLPTGESIAAWSESENGIALRVEVARDRRTPAGPPPVDGYSIALGGPAFGAEYYVARASAVHRAGGAAVLEQQFFLLVTEQP